jgi:hypothetical protein
MTIVLVYIDFSGKTTKIPDEERDFFLALK